MERITPKYPSIEENYSRDLYNLGYVEPENVRQDRLNKIADKDTGKQFKYFLYIIIGFLIIGFIAELLSL